MNNHRVHFFGDEFKNKSMNKITITRALSELKTLESRFNKKCSELTLTAVEVSGKLISPNNMYLREDFEKKSRADYQSLIDTYNIICTIKSRIDESNAKTKIQVSGKEMLVQEVLVRKKYLDLQKNLLNRLKQDYTRTVNALDCEQKKLDEYLESLHTSLAGTKETDYETIDKAARNAKKIELVDGCDIKSKIAELEKMIETYTKDIDIELSTVNSTTFIEIP